MNQEALLIARKIEKRFFKPFIVNVLEDISLELHAGESISIRGASGEGKSTLLQILGTLDTPTAGSLEIRGEKVTEKKAPQLRNQHIGFVFQAYHLLADYTALQNVLMPALIGGKEISKGSASYRRGVELLERVGLANRIHFPVKCLSGGEKQRVAIARALCNDPEIILADEPSGNLDHTTSSDIHKLLIDCAKELHKGVIVVTHDQELAKMAERQFFLKEGKIYE